LRRYLGHTGLSGGFFLCCRCGLWLSTDQRNGKQACKKCRSKRDRELNMRSEGRADRLEQRRLNKPRNFYRKLRAFWLDYGIRACPGCGLYLSTDRFTNGYCYGCLNARNKESRRKKKLLRIPDVPDIGSEKYLRAERYRKHVLSDPNFMSRSNFAARERYWSKPEKYRATQRSYRKLHPRKYRYKPNRNRVKDFNFFTFFRKYWLDYGIVYCVTCGIYGSFDIFYKRGRGSFYCRDCFRKERRSVRARQSMSLADSYIKRILTKKSNLSYSDITPAFIEAKRQHLLLTREVRDHE